MPELSCCGGLVKQADTSQAAARTVMINFTKLSVLNRPLQFEAPHTQGLEPVYYIL